MKLLVNMHDRFNFGCTFLVIVVALQILQSEGCKPLWYNLCDKHTDCCSNYCWREHWDWQYGVCKLNPQSLPDSPPSKYQCGTQKISDKKIVGGYVAAPGQWPWMAYISVRSTETSWMCGGTLIGNRHILTAAHCVSYGNNAYNPVHPSQLRIILGEHDISKVNKLSAYKVTKIELHPSYIKTKNKIKADIAILTLNQSVKRSANINSICLPYGYLDENFVGERAIVAGWGRTIASTKLPSDVLKMMELEIVEDTRCNSYYAEKYFGDGICVQMYKKRSHCFGDSGGPLMVFKNNMWIQIGVVHGGLCGENNSPGTYTKIASYLNWIEENMEN